MSVTWTIPGKKQASDSHNHRPRRKVFTNQSPAGFYTLNTGESPRTSLEVLALGVSTRGFLNLLEVMETLDSIDFTGGW